MKRNTILFTMICFWFIMCQSITYSCWMYLEIEELEEYSDLIVIGKYNGNMREYVDSNGVGYSYWTIDLDHVLKGDGYKSIEVVTGGSSKATTMVSTDYRLIDMASQYMLLYLAESEEGTFGPITPFGIVGLEYKQGGHLLGTYNIKSERHTDDYTKIIKSVELMQITKNDKEPLQEEDDEKSPYSGDVDEGDYNRSTNDKELLKEDDEKILPIEDMDESDYNSTNVEVSKVNGTHKAIIASVFGMGLIGVVFKKVKR
ncbi:UNVERIFIED_CONTAM: hypothetical protein Cloal_2330 [Acetivibrio alkalicellulosi]